MPTLSTVLLSYNRLHLLKKTVESYLSTISVPHELIIVDNASTEDCRSYIENICKKESSTTAIFLTKNIGGEAFNNGLSLASSPYLHTSENDLEYLPSWDKKLLKKFELFPKLGQLSLYSHKPQSELGEIWEEHKFQKIIEKDGSKIFLTDTNVPTPSIFRREIFDAGARWKTKGKTSQSYKLPADYQFSQSVLKQGFWVSWNDEYVVINWGHNVNEWIKNTEYYIENYRAKANKGIEEMKKRLNMNGYDLVEENGKHKIIKK